MTLQDFLNWLLTAAGTGAAVYGIIALADKLAGTQLTGNVKFYGSIVLAFALPLVAYLAQVKLQYAQFGVDGMFSAFVVGWLVSQGINRGQSGSNNSK